MNVEGKNTIISIATDTIKTLALCIVALLLTAPLVAETPCPANIKPVPFHNSRQHQMVVQVSINEAGPYDFLLDTGTQVTVVDSALAKELGLSTSGKANVAGMSFQGQIRFAQLEMIKVGDHASANPRVLVYDMNNIRRARFAIRGLLGDDFLSRFNVFIDNARGVLCIDDTGTMAASVTGPPQAEGK